VDRDKIKDVTGPTVTKIDPIGIAHVQYSFSGQGHGLLLGCPTGRAALVVHFKVQSEVPVKE